MLARLCVLACVRTYTYTSMCLRTNMHVHTHTHTLVERFPKFSP